MTTSAKIVINEDLQVTVSDLRRLGDRSCSIAVNLRTYALTAAILRIPPKSRQAFMEARVRKWVAELRQTSAGKALTLDPDGPLPRAAVGRVKVRDIARFATLQGTDYVLISKISGVRRRKRTALPDTSWYCVRAILAIQIEGRTRGMQTIEDRFVVVRAKSFDDAERRLKEEWRSYAKPYMNTDREYVRWKLEKIEDVYLVSEDDPNPNGWEVYSRLRTRRIGRKQVWRPTVRDGA